MRLFVSSTIQGESFIPSLDLDEKIVVSVKNTIAIVSIERRGFEKNVIKIYELEDTGYRVVGM